MAQQRSLYRRRRPGIGATCRPLVALRSVTTSTSGNDVVCRAAATVLTRVLDLHPIQGEYERDKVLSMSQPETPVPTEHSRPVSVQRRDKKVAAAALAVAVLLLVMAGYIRYETDHDLPNPSWGILNGDYSYTFDDGPPAVGLVDIRPDELVSGFFHDYIRVAAPIHVMRHSPIRDGAHAIAPCLPFRLDRHAWSHAIFSRFLQRICSKRLCPIVSTMPMDRISKGCTGCSQSGHSPTSPPAFMPPAGPLVKL